jgi:menaquinone-specific isochorismate synthase
VSPAARAVTRRFDGDVDIVGMAGDDGLLWAREGAGLVGHGEHLRIDVDATDPAKAAHEAMDALAAIPVDDEVGLPGCGAVAIGALPFVPGRRWSFVVPRIVHGRAADGTRWITEIDDGSRPRAPQPPAPTEPSSFTVSPSIPPREWCGIVAAARDRIQAGELRKVVLARDVVITADQPLSIATILERLRADYPASIVYSVDGLVGASPELLVSRTGDVVRAHPMAGTVPRSGDPTADARLAARLLASTKDREEHQITIDMVLDTLLPFCSYVDAEAEPSVVTMANVQHLASLCEGRLSSPPASVLELVAALHPTPAVCGSPREQALALIGEIERLDRGRYAGPVGWVDAKGNGAFAVGIRCAEVEGTTARLFAGVGVVADSDPDAELAETRAKLQALLSAIVRP